MKAISICFIRLCVTSIVIGQLVFAQTPRLSTSVRMERRINATNAAYSAFERDDAQSAMAVISSSLDQEASAPHVDLQAANLLAAVCYRFQNGGDGLRAANVAIIALAKADSPQGRMRPKDAAAALDLCAGLSENVLGDTAQARQLYQKALAIDPNNRKARDSIMRLTAIGEAAASKAIANTILSGRKAEARR